MTTTYDPHYDPQLCRCCELPSEADTCRDCRTAFAAWRTERHEPMTLTEAWTRFVVWYNQQLDDDVDYHLSIAD